MSSFTTLQTFIALLILTLSVWQASSAPRSQSESVSSSGGIPSSSRNHSASRTTPRTRSPGRGAVIEKVSPCSALLNGRLINLSPLADTTFHPGLVTEFGGWTYSFNPCFPFNVPENPYLALEDQCDFVAMCQSKQTGGGHVAYTLGIQQTTSFQMHPPRGGSTGLSDKKAGKADDILPAQQPAEIYLENNGHAGNEEEEHTAQDNEAGEEGAPEEEEETEEEEGEGGEEEVEDDGEEMEEGEEEVEDDEEEMEEGEEEVEDNEEEMEEGEEEVEDDEEEREEEEGEEEEEGSGEDDDDDNDDDGDDNTDIKIKSDDETEDQDDETEQDPGESGGRDTTTSGAGRRRGRKGRKSRRPTDDTGHRERRGAGDEAERGRNRRGRRKRPLTTTPGPQTRDGEEGDTYSPIRDTTISSRRTREGGPTTRRDSPGEEGAGEVRVQGEVTTPGLRSTERRRRVSRAGESGVLALRLAGIRSLKRQKTYIYLKCDLKGRIEDKAEFRFLTSRRAKLYFELRHLCCCPDACPPGVVRTAASLDGPEDKTTGASLWPPHELLWVVVSVFFIIFLAIIIGTTCCRTGGAHGPYTMLPVLDPGGINALPPRTRSLHSSRLTVSSMDSVRMPAHKFPSPDYLDYTSPKFKQALYPHIENGIVLASDLEIGQRLGGGLFGDTYLGELHDRNVSAKRITVGVHQGQLTDNDRVWLCDVINKLSKLQHKHILTVLGICLDLRQPHIIKEYVEGDSLRDLLVNVTDGSLTYSRKLRMLGQAADGMIYLHSLKHIVLHRDLRCANLIVSRNDDHVKITDFGMVQVLHKLRIQCTGRDGCYCRKSTPAFPASIRWTAPEVLRHPTSDETTSEIFGPASDVFSFGMTIWEAVNSADPWFNVPDEDNVMDAVLRGGRPEPTTPEGMPDAHVSLMRACWTETPEKRPPFKQILSHISSLVKQVSRDRRRERRDSVTSSTMNYFRSALNISS